ncbi:hypothetical protein Dda_8336 [Drechslerella dactyloides]|uniref:Phosphatidic acid phosphatase type 2/haloperoxidase domain-containing protein n=1 Tax=Drechslerella dactyloides TaxID=74499 RepID=A0AAD6IRD1_DREDA|nr:hypothetical protein Dda_8336 [Drechslerella dactyloides]
MEVDSPPSPDPQRTAKPTEMLIDTSSLLPRPHSSGRSRPVDHLALFHTLRKLAGEQERDYIHKFDRPVPEPSSRDSIVSNAIPLSELCNYKLDAGLDRALKWLWQEETEKPPSTYTRRDDISKLTRNPTKRAKVPAFKIQKPAASKQRRRLATVMPNPKPPRRFLDPRGANTRYRNNASYRTGRSLRGRKDANSYNLSTGHDTSPRTGSDSTPAQPDSMRPRSESGDTGVLPTSEPRSSVGKGGGRMGGFRAKVAAFLREFALDWLAILIFLIIAFVINKYVPEVGGRTRYFRLLPGENTSPQMESLGHPYRKQIVTFWASAGLDVGIPALFIGFMELCTHKSFITFARGMMGAIHSVITCCLIQIILKTLSGGFRPNFLEICQPQPNGPGAGWDGTWYQWTICTGDPDKIEWALESFPSGHVATSFAAAVYLSLYINAKLKVFADHRSNPLIIFFFLMPLTLATLMGGAISADMSHHSYDIVGGAILGSFVAALVYRNTYASLFDPRTNHIGLSSSRRFVQRSDEEYLEYRTHFGFPVFEYPRKSE